MNFLPGVSYAFALAIFCSVAKLPAIAEEDSRKIWHFAPNANLAPNGAYAPAGAGFNLADVSTKQELDLLPEGTKGLVWIGQCEGVTTRFESTVSAVIDDPKAFGFYLMDDPDPTGRWRPLCRASDLRAESDWIHGRRRDAITFVALMNLGSSAKPKFSSEYQPQASHVDLFGVAPYPCRTEWSECDYEMIDRFVDASEAAGIHADQIVPTFQTFGGGEWRADSGGAYRLPRPDEMHLMLERWDTFIPVPAFDFAYSWGAQRSDVSLAGSPELQTVFARRNLELRPTGLAQ